MGNKVFTAHGGEEANRMIQAQLDVVCEEILKEIHDVRSIILAGGFGRGEGSVKISEDKITPINDYDVYVITDNRVPEELLSKISKRAEQRIGTEGYSPLITYPRYSFEKMFYVDLKAIPLNKLKTLPPMVKYFELKHAGRVLYGEDTRKHIRDYKVSEIPSVEGIRLLFNRISHLVEWMNPRFLTGEIDEEYRDTVENMVYNCTKSFLSICEALLLLSEKYVPTYWERMQIFERSFQGDFPELHSALPDLPSKIVFFTELKRKTEFNKINDPIALWFSTRNYLGTVTKYVLTKYLQENGNDEGWISFINTVYKKLGEKYFNEYIKFYLNTRLHLNLRDASLTSIAILAQIYLNVSFTLRIHKIRGLWYPKPLFDWADPGLKIFAASPLVLFSITKTGDVDIEMLKTAINFLKKAYPTKIDAVTTPLQLWDDVKNRYLEAYKFYYFQKDLV